MGEAGMEAADGEASKATYLPLMTSDRKQLLPIHFLSQSESGNEEVILQQWLDVCATENGLVVSKQRIAKPPLLVAQMTEEWLNHYRKLAQSSVAPFSTRTSNNGNAACTGSPGSSSSVVRHHRSSPTISSCSLGSNPNMASSSSNNNVDRNVGNN